MNSPSPLRTVKPQAERRRHRAFVRIVVTALSLAVLAVLAAVPTLSATAATTRPASSATLAAYATSSVVVSPLAAAYTSLTAVPAVPDAHWVLVDGWYPTDQACISAGLGYLFADGIDFMCQEINRGYYFTWGLWLLMPG